MDPITQGTIGAAAAQTRANRTSMVAFSIFGALAGLAPDLDVFITSSTDPLLFLEYHRHFTHALIFIPFGAAIVTLALFKLFNHGLTFKQAYLASLLGYATHGLLDACTSYGTQLFWPFSDMRVSWNNVSVVDPLFTLPFLGCVIAAVVTRRSFWTWTGITWAVAYLLLGLVQLQRATDGAEALAAARDHKPARLTMKPSFANLLVWKSIYEHNNHYYVDAIRTGTTVTVCDGAKVEKLDLAQHLPGLDPNSQQARDVERFRWFSQDYLSPLPEHGLISDMRYSLVPDEVDPMWGIRVDVNKPPQAHVDWWSSRELSEAKRTRFWNLLNGSSCRQL